MNSANKRLWLAIAILMPLGLMWEFHPLTDASSRLNQFPRKTGQVESSNLALTAGEQAIYCGAAVLKRIAVVGNNQVVITVIDGTHNRHAVHDPVFCFRGAGWTVSARESLPVGNGTASLLHLRRDTDVADALYWFSDGNEKFNRPLLYWWKTALRRLTFGASGNEPVLVILTSAGDSLPDWPQLLKAWPELQAL